MLKVQVVITGNKEEIAKLRKLGDKLTDFSAPLKKIGSELKTYYSQTAFKAEGSVYGKTWQDLSPRYQIWKRDHIGSNRGILIASGKMQKSFRAVSDKDTLVVDNTDPKFKWHQLGTGYGGGATFGIARGGSAHIGRGRNLPARPMIGVNTAVLNIIGGIIKADIDNKLESVR